MSKKIFTDEFQAVLQEFIRTYDPASKNGDPKDQLKNWLSCFDVMFQEKQRLNSRQNRKKNLPALQTAYVGLLALGYLTLYFHQKEEGVQPISPTLVSSDGKPNPNWVLRHLLAQIANHSYAIVRLAELGVEGSGRILLRSLREATMLLLAVVHSESKLKAYLTGPNEVDDPLMAKKHWRENFAFRHLQKEMVEIESTLGHSIESVSKDKASRDFDYGLYSGSVHASYLTSIACSYAADYDDPADAKRTFALFGAGKGGGKLIAEVNDNTVDLLLKLFPLLRIKHGFEPAAVKSWESVVEVSTFFLSRFLPADEDSFDVPLVRELVAGPSMENAER